METYRDELYHHGVKGMKWGVRRYQNKDGSPTPLGKKRQPTKEKVKLDRATKRKMREYRYNKESKAKSEYDKKTGNEYEIAKLKKDLAREKLRSDSESFYYNYKSKQANEQYSETASKRNAYVNKKVTKQMIDKYGKDKVDALNRSDAINSGIVTAAALAAVGGMVLASTKSK